MIASLRGALAEKHPNRAIVDVGGVGYDVAIPVSTFSALADTGAPVSLHIHTHVREDALALYGFLRGDEKRLFERLIAVSGIGPKLAIIILSGMPLEQMVAAIRSGDHARLTRIPGIGRKTAERMVLELRDKLDAFAATPSTPAATPVEEDVLSALMNLGYGRPAAERALAAAARNGKSSSFDALFRNSLAALSK